MSWATQPNIPYAKKAFNAVIFIKNVAYLSDRSFERKKKKKKKI